VGRCDDGRTGLWEKVTWLSLRQHVELLAVGTEVLPRSWHRRHDRRIRFGHVGQSVCGRTEGDIGNGKHWCCARSIKNADRDEEEAKAPGKEGSTSIQCRHTDHTGGQWSTHMVAKDQSSKYAFASG
jgi:hypothetical protein